MDRPAGSDNPLGTYLKDRRARLDPAAFGFPLARRRTPGLRREEVAGRACISPTWYAWLEQGRGGAPSEDVLDRIARALMLTDVEREHLFLLGRGHAPERPARRGESVSPRLQRVLDALEPGAALIRNATWDVLAWNRAVAVILTDYAALPPGKRNILRQIFLDPEVRRAQADWEAVARFAVGAFRADALRAGALEQTGALIEELSRASPDFDRIWRENEVSEGGGGLKSLHHPALGRMALEHSAFGVDGRADLFMVVYSPTTAADADRIRALTAAQA